MISARSASDDPGPSVLLRTETRLGTQASIIRAVRCTLFADTGAVEGMERKLSQPIKRQRLTPASGVSAAVDRAPGTGSIISRAVRRDIRHSKALFLTPLLRFRFLPRLCA